MKNLDPNKSHDWNRLSVRMNQLFRKYFQFTFSTQKKQKPDKKTIITFNF